MALSPFFLRLRARFQRSADKQMIIPFILRKQRFQPFHAFHAQNWIEVLHLQRKKAHICNADAFHLVRLAIQISNIMVRAIVLICLGRPCLHRLIAIGRQFKNGFYQAGGWGLGRRRLLPLRFSGFLFDHASTVIQILFQPCPIHFCGFGHPIFQKDAPNAVVLDPLHAHVQMHVVSHVPVDFIVDPVGNTAWRYAFRVIFPALEPRFRSCRKQRAPFLGGEKTILPDQLQDPLLNLRPGNIPSSAGNSHGKSGEIISIFLP